MIQLGDLFVNRSDGYGRYLRDGKSYTSKDPVTDELLAQHISGEVTIGLHTTNPETQTCLWSCLDYDDHDGTKDPAVYRAVMATYGELRDRGFNPVLEDSNGAGGYHLWLLFEAPAPAAAAYALAKGIAERHQVPGTETRNPEGFPKQPRVRDGGWGNFVRVPGRHHKRRDHWSLIYDGGAWHSLSVPDNWALLTDAPRCPLTAFPETASVALIGAPLIPDVLPAHIGKGTGEGVPEALKAIEEEDRKLAPTLLYHLGREYIEDYDRWLKVGMVLHGVFGGDSQGLAIWDGWSMSSEKYKPGTCAEKWGTFRGGEGLGIGSLIHWAKGAEEATEDAIRRLESIHGTSDSGEQQPPPDLGEEGRKKALEYIRQATRLSVLRWIQRGHEAGEERYYLVLEGVEDEVEIGDASAVLGYAAFKSRIYAQARIQLAVGRKAWARVTAHLALIVEVEEIEEETYLGRIRDALEAYFDTVKVRTDPPDEIIAAGKPFKSKGCLYVQVRKVVAASGLVEPYKTFARAGWDRVTLSIHGTSRSYWSAPIDSESVPGRVR